MSNSQAAAVHVVPLLARIVLCIVFLPAGYSKLFDSEPISAERLAQLERMGWSWTPPSAETSSTDAAAGATGGESAVTTPAVAPPSSGADGEPRVRKVDLLAFTVSAAGLPAPRLTAWLVGIIEFLGGGLILIGLFSRLCALGLAAVMAGAIYTTSLAALQAHPYIFGMPAEAKEMFTVQIALFVLAFGVLLTGPGGLSLDHALFGGRSKAHPAPRSGGNGGA